MTISLIPSLNKDFWKERRVLLTGHSGFKGAWMTLLLENLGAEITGVSLSPLTNPSLHDILTPWKSCNSIICDIRDRSKFSEVITECNPEIVIHMAAQPLVRYSYGNPIETIETNVMGTIYLLEALRGVKNLTAVLVITSDKVYANHNDTLTMKENSPLGGHDPYSASKAATEIVTYSYAQSFFSEWSIPVCTARAGNVIGGGDWSEDRIIPDLWRAYINQRPVELRYPQAVRPWQHVIDPLYGYLLYIEQMANNNQELPNALNFGPPSEIFRTVQNVAECFSEILSVNNLWFTNQKKGDLKTNTLIENTYLAIDSSQAKTYLNWQTMLDVDTSIQWSCDWYKAFKDGLDMRQFSQEQIIKYMQLSTQSDHVLTKTRKAYG